ncbi:MAG: glutaredoxin family protein [Actinomycetota bacterium]|jgi:mycoredoxin
MTMTMFPRRALGGVPVVVYGNRWCGITQMIRRTLDRAGIAYDYVDLDTHPDVERRLRWTVGRGFRQPLVYIGGRWLEQPSPAELQRALLMAHAA